MGKDNGFGAFEEIPDEQAIERLTVIVQGWDQTGKSSLAYTAPGPVAVLTFDPENTIGTIRRHRSLYPDKRVLQTVYELPKSLNGSKLQLAADKEWARYEKDYRHACSSGLFRTVVMDLEQDAWELARYEEFGEKATSTPRNFRNLNSDYKGLLSLPRKYGVNLVMVTSLKEIYKNSKNEKGVDVSTATGKFTSAGFKYAGHGAGLRIECYKKRVTGGAAEFQAKIVDCRLDATKEGVEISGEDLNFAAIASFVTDTGVELWA